MALQLDLKHFHHFPKKPCTHYQPSHPLKAFSGPGSHTFIPCLYIFLVYKLHVHTTVQYNLFSSIIFFVTGFFSLAFHFWDSSTLSWTWALHFFLWLNNIPWYEYVRFCLFLNGGTWGASLFVSSGNATMNICGQISSWCACVGGVCTRASTYFVVVLFDMYLRRI